MEEPTHKKKNELWTVEAGVYDDYQVCATFERRGDAVKYRNAWNAKPDLSSDMRAYIGTIQHNPS